MKKVFFGLLKSRNEKVINKTRKIVEKINALDEKMSKLSDEELKQYTSIFKERLNNGESLDNITVEAYAVVREASKRILGMKHFDVQLIAGLILKNRCIAEMSTGEGKTLTAILPAYLYGLTGKGVHIVTVNDYLAQRDADNNRPLFEFLGLTVGVIKSALEYNPSEKKKAYDCDIVYGTNNELAFDYLRDNMVYNIELKTQRGLHYAIVDEVDSILIDEARTPLIISGNMDLAILDYPTAKKIAKKLKKQEKEDNFTRGFEYIGDGDFYLDLKNKDAIITDRGLDKIEKALKKENLLQKDDKLYTENNILLLTIIKNALKAEHLFHNKKDYIVVDGEVLIIDEHTGRVMNGRRWNNGLHQAVECKENVEIHEETVTQASITFQNFFRLYENLSGMTGTADTEAGEFHYIYNLETIVIPTNKPIIRKDFNDLVFFKQDAKFNAIVKEIIEINKKGQPLLVGTSSVENSEYLGNLLKEKAPYLNFNILNAENHAREAEIISNAGKKGSITISTNMAGRGTDIILGGNYKALLTEDKTIEEKEKIFNNWKKDYQEVVELGGLYVLGTERHESRRIDNQLRGRSGRQGDPGISKFYVSLEDELTKIFLNNGMKRLFEKNANNTDSFDWKFLSKAVASAQKKVENMNYEIRKHLLEYDDVTSEQRKIIYAQRDFIMSLNDEEGEETLLGMLKNVIPLIMLENFNIENDSEDNFKKFESYLFNNYGITYKVDQNNLDIKTIEIELEKLFEERYFYQKESFGFSTYIQNFKFLTLKILDYLWMRHLGEIDELKKGIGLRGYAQKDPKHEFKLEMMNMFQNLLDIFRHDITSLMLKIEKARPDEEHFIIN